MSLFIETFKNFFEFKNFGVNLITLAFLATIIISSYQIRATLKQNRKIKHRDSAESWTIALFAYLCFYYLSYIFYGLHNHSLTYLISGLPGLFYIPIMAGIWKRKKIPKLDILASTVLFLIIPLMIYSNYKGILLLLMFGIGATSMIAQTYRMIKFNDFSHIEPSFLISFVTSSTFWLLYSVSIRDPNVQISSGLSLAFLTLILIFYYR